MGALVLSTAMDGIANTLIAAGANTSANVYPYPTQEAVPPCWIVGFPEGDSDLDETYARGSDETTFPIYYVAGRVSDQSARDLCSSALTLAKTSLDGNLGGACQTCRLARWTIQWVEIDTVSHVGIRFLLEVVS